MSDAKCYHLELRRTVDLTIGGAMVFRCASKDCGRAFAVKVIDENSAESARTLRPDCGENHIFSITIQL